MSDLSIEKEIQKQQKFYPQKTGISFPYYYFDQMKQKIKPEFPQVYGEKNVETLTIQVEELKTEIAVLTSRLEKMEKHSDQSLIEMEPTEFHIIPDEQATVQIEEYINEHQGARTSDIICDLGIDPNVVLRVLHTLQQEKKIMGKKIEQP
ncbi:MAG: hypothetical protein FWH37_06065 [Candidatus Bathyarchaeota archaeon]|nr:hypothetical protein [Candidatus Termiticorpusculum sp.]